MLFWPCIQPGWTSLRFGMWKLIHVMKFGLVFCAPISPVIWESMACKSMPCISVCPFFFILLSSLSMMSLQQRIGLITFCFTSMLFCICFHSLLSNQDLAGKLSPAIGSLTSLTDLWVIPYLPCIYINRIESGQIEGLWLKCSIDVVEILFLDMNMYTGRIHVCVCVYVGCLCVFVYVYI